MSGILRLKRFKTTAARLAYTPASGEPVYDITQKKLYIGDGETPGGFGVESATSIMESSNRQNTVIPAGVLVFDPEEKKIFVGDGETLGGIPIDTIDVLFKYQRTNTVLDPGEIVFDKDEKRLYYGDGNTTGGIPLSLYYLTTTSERATTVLKKGYLVYDIDDNKVYIGDGITYGGKYLFENVATLGPDGKIDQSSLPSNIVYQSSSGVIEDSSIPQSIPRLDDDNKIKNINLPDFYVEVNSENALLSVKAKKGTIAKRTDINKYYILKEDNPAELSNWVLFNVGSGGIAVTETDPLPGFLHDKIVAGSNIIIELLSYSTGHKLRISSIAPNTTSGTPPFFNTVPDQTMLVGSNYYLSLSNYVTLTDNDPIILYEISSGNLPTGLSLNTMTGLVYGTPQTISTSTVGFRAKDKDGWSNVSNIIFNIVESISDSDFDFGSLDGSSSGNVTNSVDFGSFTSPNPLQETIDFGLIA